MPDTPQSLFTPEELIRQLSSTASTPNSGPLAGPTPAPKGIGAAPYIAAIGGQLADLGSTLHNFSRGYGESNGLYGSGQPSGKIALAKAGGTLGSVLLMRYLASHGHPTVAKGVGYATGASGAIPAMINMAQPTIK